MRENLFISRLSTKFTIQNPACIRFEISITIRQPVRKKFGFIVMLSAHVPISKILQTKFQWNGGGMRTLYFKLGFRHIVKVKQRNFCSSFPYKINDVDKQSNCCSTSDSGSQAGMCSIALCAREGANVHNFNSSSCIIMMRHLEIALSNFFIFTANLSRR